MFINFWCLPIDSSPAGFFENNFSRLIPLASVAAVFSPSFLSEYPFVELIVSLSTLTFLSKMKASYM